VSKFPYPLYPPRPAEEVTIRTLQLLLSCGVPNKNIVLGYNKLSHLNYEKNGRELQVEFDGLISPKIHHLEAIKEAKKVFFEDLKREFRHDTFQAEQIVEFDSRSGWNLHAILKKIVDNLPSDTLLMVSRSAEQAFDEAKKRNRKNWMKKENPSSNNKRLYKFFKNVLSSRM
jgi:hypothetical protein